MNLQLKRRMQKTCYGINVSFKFALQKFSLINGEKKDVILLEKETQVYVTTSFNGKVKKYILTITAETETDAVLEFYFTPWLGKLVFEGNIPFTLKKGRF